ncbi:XRE family transcriptional regulator [Kaistia algarum]|uniref:helix-turn-helix domain-containing protein n=1 Tax=Kaistia algarum TaxID=2083279 RepID=UPI000CE8D1CF|nr:helix-turn-helix transcriptional regulator [Kaistia algarum]MCX5512234.1 helix-turn-helix transcriptional regulator [Kaistia algarum]PPE80330.1 XRE family transcriptional regulator [Kaistia algarum]
MHSKDMRSIEAQEREEERRKAGAYIRHLRQANGLTQLELAQLVEIGWYTNVGQIEQGKTALSPKQMHLWADAFGVDRSVFAKRLMFHYEPHYWEMIFGNSRSSRTKGA